MATEVMSNDDQLSPPSCLLALSPFVATPRDTDTPSARGERRLYIGLSSPEKQNHSTFVHLEKELYCKELPCMVMEAEKSKICSREARDSGELMA